jgi:DNA (cytosine-5)-methyltransferase 1
MTELRGRSYRLLDLFCGAGGAGEGYRRAGFDVVGVDHHLKRAPFHIVYADALEFLDEGGWRDFDAIHASPPCQRYSSLASLNGRPEYPDLIVPVRERLQTTGLPFVIENVVGAPLRAPIMLCGSAFPELAVRRHRLFECSFPATSPGCAHDQEAGSFPIGLGSPSNRYRKRMGWSQDARSRVAYVYGSCRYPGDLADRQAAMGIPWMSNRDLTQAIPPAYTEHIGRQLVGHLAGARVEAA